EHVVHRDEVETDAEVVGEGAGVFDRMLGAVAGGHGDAPHVLGPEGVGGDGGGERRVDASGQAEDDRVEPVLAHVIAETGRQGGVDLGDGVEQRGDVSGDDLLAGQRNVDHEAVFGELGRAVDHRPVGGDHHAGAVEDELVLAPDQVHVYEGRPRRPGPGREHLLPLGRLAAVERGSVDV